MMYEPTVIPVTTWHPFKPGLFTRFTAARQIGHKDWSYVMRRKADGKWQYRLCTPEEAFSLETMLAKAAKSRRLQQSR